ncbi:hypothetical protein ABTK14_24715, partial [Acinetobacter baumannii]
RSGPNSNLPVFSDSWQHIYKLQNEAPGTYPSARTQRSIVFRRFRKQAINDPRSGLLNVGYLIALLGNSLLQSIVRNL